IFYLSYLLPLFTESSCEEGRFRCNNGNCIPNRWRCDQENDCADGSDETPAMCMNYCKHHEIKCKNGEQCIPISWKCDGSPDCRDKSDEENCRKLKKHFLQFVSLH
uniref:Uncharacterized protein n=1 Tax=Glossina morsitans morsitans TaxID=37546 RepID=A0A1B0FQL0_GLOMM